MNNQEFATLVAAAAPALEKLGEHIAEKIAAGQGPDPEAEHQLALDLIRSVWDAQAKKELVNP